MVRAASVAGFPRGPGEHAPAVGVEADGGLDVQRPGAQTDGHVQPQL